MWQERYLRRATGDVAAFSQHQPRALYLLTSHEGVAFEQDGVRDGQHLREWMTEQVPAAILAGEEIPPRPSAVAAGPTG